MVLDQPTRRLEKQASDACDARVIRHERAHLGKAHHATTKDYSPDKLDRDGNPIRGVIRSVLGGVVEDTREEETDGNGPLVETDDGTADPLGRTLGLIHWNQSGDQTHADTSEDTTDDEERNGCCRGLESDSNGEDQT